MRRLLNVAVTALLLAPGFAVALTTTPASASAVTRWHDEALFDDGYIFSDLTVTQTPSRGDTFTYVVRETAVWAVYGGPDGPVIGERRYLDVARLNAFTPTRSVVVSRDVFTVGESVCTSRYNRVWNGETLVVSNFSLSCAP
jgi:hypothetical protein